MAGNWLTELTGASKPIIGMAHLPALPGTPLYDSAAGMAHVRDWVARDLDALQLGLRSLKPEGRTALYDGLIEALEPVDRRRPYRLTGVGATALKEQLASLEAFARLGLRRLGTDRT